MPRGQEFTPANYLARTTVPMDALAATDVTRALTTARTLREKSIAAAGTDALAYTILRRISGAHPLAGLTHDQLRDAIRQTPARLIDDADRLRLGFIGAKLPGNPFEGFSQAADVALLQAAHVAGELGATEVIAEHILIALFEQPASRLRDALGHVPGDPNPDNLADQIKTRLTAPVAPAPAAPAPAPVAPAPAPVAPPAAPAPAPVAPAPAPVAPPVAPAAPAAGGAPAPDPFPGLDRNIVYQVAMDTIANRDATPAAKRIARENLRKLGVIV